MSTEQAVNHSTKDYVLSIDNGTQSVRAMLFDAAGHLYALSRIEIEPYVSAQPGWAEQEADYYWQAVGQACGANPFPLIVPCHRVTSAQGLGGFAHSSGGWLLEVKRWLLRHEGAT